MVIGRFTKRAAGAFQRDRSGNVAMMWALMGTVLIGLVGLTVDFTRAQAIRNAMQNAADGAALVAERSSNLSMDARTAAARAFFDAEVGDMVGANVTFEVSQLVEGGHRVVARAPMPVSLARIISNNDWTIGVEAEAQANASPPIEVALVLDNTGSMANDMGALRSAASSLATDLLSLDGDSVKVALVPFVAQVNIGNDQSHLAWMDQAGTAPYHGELLEDRSIGHRSRSGTSNCTASLPAPPSGSAYPITWRRGGGLLGGLLGGGNGASSRCYAWTPSDGINHFTLFDRLSNEDWKGCVEARPEPYDITDAAPSTGTPATMFVPYFWLDTLDPENNGNSNTSNNYIDDDGGDITGLTMTTSMSAGGGSPQQQSMAHMFNPYKFRNTSASIDTSSPDTRGPNRGCPTPIVPLTTSESTIQTNISAMRHWSGGGTNQAEGLAWGWRVLSPTAPFTEGAAYGPNVRKVIVLMSDGENTNVGFDPVLASDYSAYNHLGLWRDLDDGTGLLGQLVGAVLMGVLPPQYRRNINNSGSFVSYINSREAQLCTNIKNSGIEIYTVIFRETDQTTENLMRNCASGNDHFFRADNAAELAAAFDAIGTGIGSLRLTR
jgi:Flp pilus assembly protein TadG